MTAENNRIPDQERQRDLAWIGEHVAFFWETAVMGSRLIGRGAIVVDVEAQPMGNDNLLSYFPQADLERFEDDDMMRLVQQYQPDSEFVLVLLKPEARTSSYRVRPQPPQ
jgi:hypothetical protein